MFSNHHLAPAGMLVLMYARQIVIVFVENARFVCCPNLEDQRLHITAGRVFHLALVGARVYFFTIQINTQKHIARCDVQFAATNPFHLRWLKYFSVSFLICAMDSELITQTFHLRARYFHLLHKIITKDFFHAACTKPRQNMKNSNV